MVDVEAEDDHLPSWERGELVTNRQVPAEQMIAAATLVKLQARVSNESEAP